MNEAWKKATVNKWLAANCFGDYYTRTGLDLKQREMITFVSYMDKVIVFLKLWPIFKET